MIKKISRRLLTYGSGFSPRNLHVKLVVDKVAGQGSGLSLSTSVFSCQYHSTRSQCYCRNLPVLNATAEIYPFSMRLQKSTRSQCYCRTLPVLSATAELYPFSMLLQNSTRSQCFCRTLPVLNATAELYSLCVVKKKDFGEQKYIY